MLQPHRLTTLLFLIFGIAINAQTPAVKLRNLEKAPGADYKIKSNALGVAEWASEGSGEIEVNLVAIGYIPTATGNASNLNQVVIDPNGDVWLIDSTGDAMMLETVYDGSETIVIAGSNTTITGTGKSGDPYVINATAGSGTVADLDSIVNITYSNDTLRVVLQSGDTIKTEIIGGGGSGDPDQTLSFVSPNLTISGSGGNSVDISGIDTDTQRSDEEIEDVTGSMFTGNTESLITSSYDDPSGKVNLTVDPNLSSYNNDTGFLTSEVDGSVSNEIQNLNYVSATRLLNITSGVGVTLPEFVGATSGADGVAGLVPGALAGQESLFLRADGSWSNPTTGGDGWGAQVVQSDLSLIGDGTAINLLKVDTSLIASLYALIDTASAIRADFPSVVSDGNGLISALPLGNVTINASNNDLIFNNISQYTIDPSDYLLNFNTSTFIDLDASSWLFSNEGDLIVFGDPQDNGNGMKYVIDGNGFGLYPAGQNVPHFNFVFGDSIGLSISEALMIFGSDELDASNVETFTGWPFLTSEVDGSITNELQDLAYIADTRVLNITSGNGITLPEMVGATSGEDGVSGLVPGALAGEENLFLRADGTWATTGGTMDGFYLSAGPGDGFLIGDSDTTMFLTLPGLDHTRTGNRISFDLAFNELSPYNGQFIDTLRLATYNQTTGQHLLLDPASLYNYFIPGAALGTDIYGLRIQTDFSSGDDATYYFTGSTPVDSIQIYNFDSKNYIQSSSDLTISAPNITLGAATNLRITNTLATDNTNLKVLAVDPLSKYIEEVEVSSFGVGGDGNGLFSPTNNGGTVSSDYVVNITDTLSFEGGVFRANATERVDLNFISTPDRYTLYSTKDENNIIDVVQRVWEVSTDLAAGASYRIDYGNNQAYSAFAAEGDDQGEYSAYMFVDDDTPTNSYASIRVEDLLGSNELTGFFAYRNRLEMWDSDQVIMNATSSQITLGNYTFDTDQTVGAGQDNFVMTYDHASGQVRLEAATGGGGGDPDQTLTWTDGANTIGISGTGGNDVVITGFADQTHSSTHLNGGADEIDGDQIDIDFVPSTYSRTTIPSEVDNIAELTSHLSGIDNYLDVVETDDVGSQTSNTLDWGAEQGRVIKLDMTGLSSISLTLSNPRNGGVYTVIFTNADDGDTVTWPGTAIYETGSAISTDALSSGRRMFTMVYDGTNYYVAGGY